MLRLRSTQAGQAGRTRAGVGHVVARPHPVIGVFLMWSWLTPAAAEVDPVALSHCAALTLDPTTRCQGTLAELPRAQCQARACGPALPDGPCRDAMLSFHRLADGRRARFSAAKETCERWLIAHDPEVASGLPRASALAWLARRAIYPHFGLGRPSLATYLHFEFAGWRDESGGAQSALVFGRLANEVLVDLTHPELLMRAGIVDLAGTWLLPLRFGQSASQR